MYKKTSDTKALSVLIITGACSKMGGQGFAPKVRQNAVAPVFVRLKTLVNWPVVHLVVHFHQNTGQKLR
jgi:hypothetical protein